MKNLKRIGIAIAVIAIILGALNIIQPEKNIKDNPFCVAKGEKPMVAAHRGGAINYPENTMLAFRSCVNEDGVEIVETDLCLTKDGYLVYNHDECIDRTSNVNGDISKEEAKKISDDKTKQHLVCDMTLAELETYNFGYYFEDEEGNRPYKDVENLYEAGLQIATIDELFEEFKDNSEIMFILEIKDSGENGKKACAIMAQTLEKYPQFKNRVVVGTVHKEIENELSKNYPGILRGASTSSATSFLATELFRVNIFDQGTFACLQIPTSYDVGITLNLDKEHFVKRAHRRNIAVQYWTINEEKEMRELIDIGCDCIMTDDVKLLNDVLETY